MLERRGSLHEISAIRGEIMPLPTIFGVLIGGGVGFAWYRWISCSSGACPMLSNPYTSTLYGMILGGLIGSNLR